MYAQYPYNVPQHSEVIRVNGENGARAYQLMPNCSALLLDETAPLVWLAQTDGAGYKTVTPYKIEPYQPEPAPDLNALIDRIAKLEERLNESNITGNDRQVLKQSAESAGKRKES